MLTIAIVNEWACSSTHVLQMEATGHQLKEITDCVKITEMHVEITVKDETVVTTVGNYKLRYETNQF